MSVEKLNTLAGYQAFDGPVVLVIMDGVGLGPEDESNGVFMAHTPVLDELLAGPLVTQLKAHGVAVGLPSDEDMGNSEVGHNALGAGRVFAQGAKLINEALETGKIFQGKAWRKAIERCRKGGTMHLIGMVSDGNVHSHVNQLYRLLEQCVEENVTTVRIHGLLDGRDVAPKSGLDFFVPLEERLTELSRNGRDYRIASGGGRMVTTMDRYGADWSVVERGWRAHVLGEGRRFESASEAISTSYAEDSDMTDQYMDSFVVCNDTGPVGTIEDGDSVILFNFRGDRAIELSRAFDEQDFSVFDRVRVPDVFYAGMMQYDGDAGIPRNFLVEPPLIERTLGEYLCATGISSMAVSETQKYGHVTYFWNGNKSGYIDAILEEYVELPSDRVTFDQRPWMRAAEITDITVEAIRAGTTKFVRLNLANGDMVGHTGDPAAVRIAVETVDLCLRRILKALKEAGGVAVITADHGNADCMWTDKNGVRTAMVAHTRNPVPLIIQNYSDKNSFQLQGIARPGLANVAATLCTVLGLEAPSDYELSLLALDVS
ncbi:MAG: 2,3-bisphosphoglycerate-independent phosphoglycerate mutase [Desulfobulbaceae bacterium]|uniref:2,3-bisphosphoglycerate-independent phosphoglycerate mutase n=1 Tax=Candidatus Desulfatifera sulfidica TaxID=2841691 RepID=A0A8J6N9R4_9BACT|nr:2,3-bisphosphoglycerate-independent phosphoglycerate mutase [Candidatus Desulfatifera sulfidica]